jgi:hypothetical protein
MMGGSFGGHMPAASASSSASFGNKNHDMVYAIIKQNNEDQGINTDAILAQVSHAKKRLSSIQCCAKSVDIAGNPQYCWFG